MKVCMISTFPPKQCGIADYTSDLSSALARKGIEVEIVTYKEPFAPKHETIKNDIKVHRILRGNPLISLKCWREIGKISADIVHMQSATGLHKRSIYFLVLPNRGRFPLVTTVHDTPTSLRLIDYIPFLRLMYKYSESIFVHTRRMKESLIRYHGVPEDRITTIPHGIDVNLYRPRVCSGNIKRSLNIGDDHVLLFFGFVRPGKGVEYLIKSIPLVLKEAPQTKLVVAGGLPSDVKRYCFYLKSEKEYISSLKQMVGMLNLNKRVVFTGYVPEDVVSEFFALADVVVFPYITCSQSGPLHKALASGKAIIATKVEGIDELIENGKNGIIVPPRDTRSLANSILNLLHNEKLRKELGKNARSTAEKLSWDAVAEITANAYSQLLKNSQTCRFMD